MAEERKNSNLWIRLRFGEDTMGFKNSKIHIKPTDKQTNMTLSWLYFDSNYAFPSDFVCIHALSLVLLAVPLQRLTAHSTPLQSSCPLHSHKPLPAHAAPVSVTSRTRVRPCSRTHGRIQTRLRRPMPFSQCVACRLRVRAAVSATRVQVCACPSRSEPRHTNRE